MTDRNDSRGRVIVTGGSGLIGRALVAELAGAGYEVVVLTREPRGVKGLPAGARAVGWDAQTADGWGEEADGALALVNLAGESIADGRWTADKKRRILDSRVHSTRAVVQAVSRAEVKPRVLVQGSAVGYYGGVSVGRDCPPLSEDAPPGDDFLADVVVRWEEASEPVEGLGVRRALARTGLVLDDEGGALPKMALPFKLFVGGPVAGGDQWVPWIHLADEVGALRFLIETPTASGPFNLAAPSPVTNGELSKAIASVLHRPALLPAPAFALKTLLGEMADVLLEGQRAVPTALEAAGFEFEYPRLRPALEDLLG